MKIFRFDADVGRPIDRFGSSNLGLSRIVRTSRPVQVGCMHLAAGGVVGYHQATVPQLFLVVQGEGWVRGAEDERVPIKAGCAAFWDGAEWHEAGTDVGMTAIVIESDTLDPAHYMVEA